MDIQLIKKLIDSIGDTDNIYLIEPLSSEAGFFTNEGKLLYIAKDESETSFNGIDTEYLKLQTHVRIKSVKNQQTFSDGYYNIIIYKGQLDDNIVSSFCHLCTVHASNANELNFNDFFYSLIELFQLVGEQTYKNAIGLYGELKLMQFAKSSFGVDLSKFWHKKGSMSKYDFSSASSCIEVKTTTTENDEIVIKHNQIFNGIPCTLAVIACNQYDVGETINDVLEEMRNEPDAFNGMMFSINLEKELKRISPKDVLETRFYIQDIKFFDTKTINPFDDLPDCVSELSYKLDLSEFQAMKVYDIKEILNAFS